MTTAIINEIGNYLRETLEDFDVRVELALKTMDRKRCPFGAALIDKVSGKGTWESNPYVWVY